MNVGEVSRAQPRVENKTVLRVGGDRRLRARHGRIRYRDPRSRRLVESERAGTPPAPGPLHPKTSLTLGPPARPTSLVTLVPRELCAPRDPCVPQESLALGILSPRTPHQAPGALHPKTSLTLGPLAPHKYRDPCTPRGLRTLVSLRAPGPLLPRSLAPREPVGPVQSTRPSAAKGPAWGALPLAKATLGAALVSCLFPAPTLTA